MLKFQLNVVHLNVVQAKGAKGVAVVAAGGSLAVPPAANGYRRTAGQSSGYEVQAKGKVDLK